MHIPSRMAVALFAFAVLGLILGTAVSGWSASSAITAKLYASPSTLTGAAGAMVAVEIHMTVSGDTANAIAANLSYSDAGLTYVRTDINSSVWGVTAANTGGSGAVDVEVGATTAVSGDQLVATVTFTKKADGSTPVSVSETSQIISATTNTDLLHPSSTGGTTTSGGGNGDGTTNQSTTNNTTPSETTGSTNQTTSPSPPSPKPKPKLVLPNKTRTPGVTNTAVKQSTIKRTICVSGWTATVRPPVSFTNTLKRKQMKQYGEKGKPSAYEEDHMIPLELGGAPRNPKNLWPEPHSQSKHSDPLETSLKRKVCAGSLKLAAARRQILTYKRTHG